MRVAVFFTPPADHPLTRSAAEWLGRDAFTGAPVARRLDGRLDKTAVDLLTADPRRYGFHATLKPPFRIAEGYDLDDIRRLLPAFCAERSPVNIAALRIERLGPFFALTPDGSASDADALAADAVRAFDRFRASSSQADVTRRRPERLTGRQRTYLRDWGYPYVFEEFRFHMTLTGPVAEVHRDDLEAVLRARFAAFLGKPLVLDALSLFIERHPPDDFVVDTRIPFLGRARSVDAA